VTAHSLTLDSGTKSLDKFRWAAAGVNDILLPGTRRRPRFLADCNNPFFGKARFLHGEIPGEPFGSGIYRV